MEKKIVKENRTRKIINYENLEEGMKAIESVLNYYDKDEKMLILRFVQQRVLQAEQKLRMNDQLHNIPFGSLVKKMMRDEKKSEDD